MVNLPQAIDKTHLSELNDLLDSYLELEPGHWRGWVYRHPGRDETYHLHNLFEMGFPFERLIDTPLGYPTSTVSSVAMMVYSLMNRLPISVAKARPLGSTPVPVNVEFEPSSVIIMVSSAVDR